MVHSRKLKKRSGVRACLHGGGGPQISEVTCGGSPHLSCKRDQIKMRDYVERRVSHQSGLPYLSGVPHLHVNRPLRGWTHSCIISKLFIHLGALQLFNTWTFLTAQPSFNFRNENLATMVPANETECIMLYHNLSSPPYFLFQNKTYDFVYHPWNQQKCFLKVPSNVIFITKLHGPLTRPFAASYSHGTKPPC